MDEVLRRLADLNPFPEGEAASAYRSPEATMLLRRILAGDPDSAARAELGRGGRRRPVGRWTLGLVAAAIMAALVVSLLPSRESQPPSTRAVQLVSFSRAGPDIVARITNPNAPSDQLTAVFRAHGLDIKVQTLPVSPSLVGSIVYSDVPSIRELQSGPCVQGGGAACWVGMIIPASFTGQGDVSVGRAAHANEMYDSAADVFGPGEALHCTGILGQPVANALPVLASKRLRVRWQVHEGGGGLANVWAAPSGYVTGGAALSPTAVLLIVSNGVPSPQAFERHAKAVDQGC